jgi:long-chain fatty acid transport protein
MKGSCFKPSNKKVIVCLSLLFGMSNAYAGGFQLLEENVSSLGNAFAGTAAVAENASTSFYNPAGLTLLNKPEIDIAGTLIDIRSEADFDSSISNSLLGIQLGSDTSGIATAPVPGSASTQIGSWNFVPAAHVALPYCHRFAFGLSITSPYGLNTIYDGKSQARYLATTSKVLTLDVGPAFAFQVTPQLSVGAGIDIQYIKATLDQKVPVGQDLPPALLAAIGSPDGVSDAQFSNNASNKRGFGWNAGALYQFNCGRTRIGADYRSKIVHHLDGDAYLTFYGPSFLENAAGGVTASVTLPETANLSIYHDVNCQWALLGSINYTRWSQINTLTLDYTGQIQDDIESATFKVALRDAYRYAAGVNYAPTCRWKFRAGVAYDETPVRNADTRTLRIPDATRYWGALGVQFKLSDCLALDAGYSHLFIRNSTLDQSQATPLSSGAVLFSETVANFDHSSVNEYGLQLNWKIL